MKTRDEIVATAMMDWNTKRKSDDNWLKSRIEGAWNSGYANAEAEYKEKIAEAYDKGVKNGAELVAMHGLDATNRELEDSFRKGADMGAQRIWDALSEFICMTWNERHAVLKDLDSEGFAATASLDSMFRTYNAKEFITLFREHQGLKMPTTNLEKFEEVFGCRPKIIDLPKDICDKQIEDWWNAPYADPKRKEQCDGSN